MIFRASEELWDELRQFVARALTNIEKKPLTAVISVPVPFAPLSTFLRAVPRDMSVLWNPARGVSFATSGSAVRIDLNGVDRCTQLGRALPAVWKRIVKVTHRDCRPAPIRLNGGLSFVATGKREYPWDEFGDGCFSLARWTYERHDVDSEEERAVLSLAVNGDEDQGLIRIGEHLAELDQIIDALNAYEGQRTNFSSISIPRIPESAITQLPYERWAEHIAKIHAGIRSGLFGKIVAARRCDLELPRALDDVDVLSRLAAEPGCTRFAFRGARSSFIAASPETLLLKEGSSLKTQALAGTIRSLGSELPVLSQRSTQLLGSEKDLAEHRFVIREIESSLQPFATNITYATTPKVSKIRNIMHLNTPIEAKLRPEVQVSELLAALHPTPAVGGTPKREAAAWIAANEPNTRGWYTGTVGWFDEQGDAHFVVAIRCGLIVDRSAFIFTGAGVVDDSNAAAEYAETELKQLPLLRAFGVVL